MTTLANHLHASRIIATRHPIRPPSHPIPRTKADVRTLAEHDRAVAAWAVVEALEGRVRVEIAGIEEGRRTNEDQIHQAGILAL